MSGSVSGSLWAAVVTAAVAVVVAVLTQLESWRRSRSDRAYERRRAALVDVQEAALVLRDTLREYGEVVVTSLLGAPGAAEPPGVVVSNLAPRSALDRALGRLDVCGVRLEPRAGSQAVGTALAQWRLKADEHFLSPGDLTADAEQRSWTDLNLLIGTALHE